MNDRQWTDHNLQANTPRGQLTVDDFEIPKIAL